MIDNVNTKEGFWEELCGTSAFQELGLKEINKGNLKLFDTWYFSYYPYLQKYIDVNNIKDESVLEIGLGFGSVGQLLFESAKKYVGVDNAKNPVDLMNQRIAWNGMQIKAKAITADALELPFNDDQFDTVIAIGCLHHTGNTQKAVYEVYRILKKGGRAIIMLYNKRSFRQLILNPLKYTILRLTGKLQSKDYNLFNRSTYDINTDGNVAPIVDLVTKKQVREMFKHFSKIKILKENSEDIVKNINGFKFGFSRKTQLNNIGKILGLDLYIVAKK